MRPLARLKLYAGITLCCTGLFAACESVPDDKPTSRAVEPVVAADAGSEETPDTGTEKDTEADADSTGARASFEPEPEADSYTRLDAGVPDDPYASTNCSKLRDALAADTASCYRLFPDVEACKRVTANVTRLDRMGCLPPDAGMTYSGMSIERIDASSDAGTDAE